MLLRFQVENFLSFKERQAFSLLPGKGSLKSQHRSTTIKGVSGLKAGLIFGANASGKSNLIKAIDFGRKKVLKGTKPNQLTDVNFFRLDEEYYSKSSYFEYEIQHKGKNYAYGFILNSKEIIDEWLYEIGKKSQTKIFERTSSTEYDLEYLFKKNKSEKENQFLEFTALGTPRNQLFLYQVRSTNFQENISGASDLVNVIDWFQNALTVIYPNTKNVGKKFELLHETELRNVFQKMLEYFDTGIDGIEFEEIDFKLLDVPGFLKEDIRLDLLNEKSEKTVGFLSNEHNDKYYVISKESETEIKAEILKTKHEKRGGGYALFDLKDESDGTRRIMDLIPLMIDFFKGDNVFVIDEIGRSLHPNLVNDFFAFLLENCEGINSQVIVSTHQATLLTQKLFRKDEIWFAVKNTEGATTLHSLEDYNIRFDKEIMRDYLVGRYNGIPKFGNRTSLSIITGKID